MPPTGKSTPLSEKFRRDLFFQTSPDLPRIIEVDLGQLRPHPDQPRTAFDEASIHELAASIAQHGLIQPIAVVQDPATRDAFLLVAGARRYRAFQQLGKETIPAIMTTGAPDEIALIENIQRENLHPLEEAHALANLMRTHGYTQEELGSVVGKSRPTVNELLRLTTLPKVIQDECRTFDTPKSTLVAVSRRETEQEQLTLWERVKSSGMTVREAKAAKKASPVRRVSRHPAEKALEAGRGFVQSLQKVAADDAPPERGMLHELRSLREQIHTLIAQLAQQEIDSGENT